MSESLTIGQLARAARVHVETIRYYQRHGLLRQPPRPLNGIRRYGRTDLDRLRFIKRAQHSGFVLKEIHALLGLNGRRACRATRVVAARKLEEIEERRRTLRHLRRELRAWVAACDANTLDACPTLERLAH